MSRLVLFVSILLGGFAAVSSMRAEPAEPEKKPGPSFTRDVRPFLAKYCYECHQEDMAKKGIDVSSYKKLLEGTGKKMKRMVIPGSPERSPLVRSMERAGGKRMPPPDFEHQPTATELEKVRDWISAGAPDDSVKKSRQ
jgi:hypothetical protein